MTLSGPSSPLAHDARRAVLALWAVPGVGPRRLARLQALTQGAFAELLSWTPARALEAVGAPASGVERLRGLPTLERIADLVEGRMARAGMGVAFAGEAAYPARLAGVSDAPPLLFIRGTPGPSRLRVAMVGTRLPEGGFGARARALAREVAEAGVGVISGAADGIDRACHLGALDAGGETVAFVGSALDALDGARAELLERVLAGGGVFYSELPPGVPANRFTFPRRNRLISGASDAVLVLQAGARSGSAHTAVAALAQGRPLWAVPAAASNRAAAGSNALLATGQARRCEGAAELLGALGIQRHRGTPAEPGDPADLSPVARRTLSCLSRTPIGLDDLLTRERAQASEMIGALVELELRGLALQRPGRLYERI